MKLTQALIITLCLVAVAEAGTKTVRITHTCAPRTSDYFASWAFFIFYDKPTYQPWDKVKVISVRCNIGQVRKYVEVPEAARWVRTSLHVYRNTDPGYEHRRCQQTRPLLVEPISAIAACWLRSGSGEAYLSYRESRD